MHHENLSLPVNPEFREAYRAANRIPNPPHPDRAQAVHNWAVKILAALRGTRT